MSLVAATRSEITKQFTTAGWWIIALCIVLYLGFQVGIMSAGMGFAGKQASATEMPPEQLQMLYGLGASLGYVFPLLFGTLMVTSEFRHKLIVPTFLATPKRGVALVGKMLAGLLIGVLIGAITVITTLAVVSAGVAIFGFDPMLTDIDTWTTLGRSLIALTIWVLIGIGVGSIIRNQVVSIVVVLAFTMLIEPVVRVGGVLIEALGPITKWLPGAATDAVVGQSFYAMAGQGAIELLPWWQGVLALLALAIVCAVIGSFTTWRRDVA